MEDNKKPNSLILKVSITDTELFKGVLEILKDVLNDKSIPNSVVAPYVDRLKDLMEEVKEEK